MLRAAGVFRRTGRRVRDALSRRPNRYADLPAWAYQERLVGPAIKPGDLVLDIGSGNYPSPRADILADFFVEDDSQRSGRIVDDRPLVACSVERLPFRAKSIDFAICSHVIEHIAHPAVAAAELARVARGGYIETPAYGKDILVGSGHIHRWQVVEFEGTMHFFEYSDRQREAHVSSPVMQLWIQKSEHPWQQFFWDRQDLFNAMHLWRDSPRIEEHRRSNVGDASAAQIPWSPVPRESLPNAPSRLTAREIQILEGCLATPDGLDSMIFRSGQFENPDGTIQYPVRGKRIYCALGGAEHLTHAG